MQQINPTHFSNTHIPMSQSDEPALRNGLNLFLSLLFWSSNNAMSDPVWWWAAKLDTPSISCLSSISWLNWEATNLSSALQSVTLFVLDNSFWETSSLLMLSDIRDTEVCFFTSGMEGLSSWGSCISCSACMKLKLSASVSFLYNKFWAEILFLWGCLNITEELTPHACSSYVYLRSHPSMVFVWPLVLFLNALHTTHPSSCTHSIICWMRLSLSLETYYVWLD